MRTTFYLGKPETSVWFLRLSQKLIESLLAARRRLSLCGAYQPDSVSFTFTDYDYDNASLCVGDAELCEVFAPNTDDWCVLKNEPVFFSPLVASCYAHTESRVFPVLTQPASQPHPPSTLVKVTALTLGATQDGVLVMKTSSDSVGKVTDTGPATQLPWKLLEDDVRDTQPAVEIAKLGTVPDVEIAEQRGVPRQVVATQREARGIKYLAQHDNLLGSDLDTAVARKLGVKVAAIRYRRARKGIPPYRPATHGKWTPEIDALLGKETDRVVADMVGVTVGAVYSRRVAKGIPARYPRLKTP